ncbi:MAG: NACHT domain-containing protein [Candidatus Schekmanbacteria bacterium]|nr:NACHT domain-containing protein [Candidatus Schekmanbacteria bacterium]
MQLLSDESHNQVAVGMLRDVFRSDWKTVNELLNWKTDSAREYDFSHASKNYGKKILDQFGWIKCLGLTRILPLTKLYTPLKILHKITVYHSFGLEETGNSFAKDHPGFGETRQERIEEAEIISRHQHLVLLGQPGAGKTTFLKNLCLQAVQDRLETKRLPVFIDLKGFYEAGPKTMLDFICRELQVCSFPDPQPFIIHLLKKGRFLLLLDGLNEVEPKHQAQIQKQILDFAAEYEQTQIIVTCATADYNSALPRFSLAEILDFEDQQIESFVQKWFEENTIAAQSCLEKLFRPQNKAIKELAGNPLSLSLLCLAFDETADFPGNRAELFKHAIEALLRKWDGTQAEARDEVYRQLSVKRKQDLFCQIAVQTFPRNKYYFKQKELIEYIARFLQNLPNTALDDSEAVLKAIETQHSVFIKQPNDVYSFAHLTLQEFFTAQYIVDNAHVAALRSQKLGLVAQNDGEEVVENTLDILASFLEDKKWHEVFLLVAGMLTPADDLLRAVKKKADGIISGDKSKKLLAWAVKKAAASKADYKPAAIRAFYLALALDRDRDRDRAFDRSLVLARDLGLDLDAQNVELDLALDRALALALARTFARALALALALALTRDLDRDRDHAIGLARDLSHDLDLAIDCALDSACDCADKLKLSVLAKTLTNLKETLPRQNARQQRWFEFAQELQKAMIIQRDLGYEFNLSNDELDDIEDYLYVNKLIVECLKADCYIDRDLREKILEKLLEL